MTGPSINPWSRVGVETGGQQTHPGTAGRLTLALASTAVMLGLIECWAGRYFMGPDGISYIDMADAFRHGGLPDLVNGVWSPLYPWLLSVALAALPPPRLLFQAVHLVGLGVYLFALASFEFFLRSLIHSLPNQHRPGNVVQATRMPDWALRTLGYVLFIWASLDLIGIRQATPDMCVLALVLLACGLLLRIRDGSCAWPEYPLFGFTLGVAYLSKAVMFPLGFLFLVGLTPFRRRRSAVLGFIVSAMVFLITASPLIIALSRKVGHVTYSEVGNLNYAWFVNGVSGPHPKVPGLTHRMETVFDSPAVYVFGRPIGGTYPPFYDLAYWNEGVKPHIILSQQVRALVSSAQVFYTEVISPLWGVITAGIIVLLAYPMRRPTAENIARNWPLLIPSAVALAGYSCVAIISRLVAPFVLVVAVVVLCGFLVPDDRESRRMVGSVAVAAAVSLAVQIGVCTVHRTVQWTGEGAVYWEAAESLTRLGTRSGDNVAVIGEGAWDAAWARLAGVRIVAEVPPEEENRFLAVGEATRDQVFDALSKAGVSAIVTDYMPACAVTGWNKLGKTQYCARLLAR